MSDVQRTLYADEGKGAIAGSNAYLALLIDPWHAAPTLIPDGEPTLHRYPRRLLYASTLTGRTEYLLEMDPYNLRSQVNYYVRATATDNGPDILPLKWTGPVNLQNIGDWVWAGRISPEEDLSLNYATARGVSMGYQLVSDTVSAGAFAVSGQVHTVACPQTFDFRRLGSTSLLKYRGDDMSYVTSVRVMDGVRGITEPIVTPMTPIGTDANEVGSNRLSITYATGTNVFTSTSAGPIAPRGNNIPNYGLTGSTLTSAWVPGMHFPFGLRGKISIAISGTMVVTGASGIAVTLAFYNNEFDDGTPSPIPVAHFIRETPSNGAAGARAVVDTEFWIVSAGPILGIQLVLAGVSPPAIDTGFSMTLTASEFLQPGMAEPFTLMHVEGVDVTQRISYNAVWNVEVVPTAAVQSVARDINVTDSGVKYHFDDLKASEEPFRNKENWGLRLVVPLASDGRYHTAAAGYFSDRQLLKGYAAGWWSRMGDLVRGAWGAIKPGLKQFAIEQIGRASGGLGQAAGAFRKPGYASGKGRTSVTLRGPSGTGHGVVRRTRPLLADLDELGFETQPPPGVEAPCEKCGAPSGEGLGAKVGRAAMRRARTHFADLDPPEEKPAQTFDMGPRVPWPSDEQMRTIVRCRSARFLKGPGELCQEPEYGDSLFPFLYEDGEERTVVAAIALIVTSKSPIQGVDYEFNPVTGYGVDRRLRATDAVLTILADPNINRKGHDFVSIQIPPNTVDVIEDTSFSLSLYICLSGLPSLGCYTGTLVSGSPWGVVDGLRTKYMAARSAGVQLFAGALDPSDESGALPAPHAALEVLQVREVANAVGLEYETLCQILISDGLVVRRGAELMPSGQPVTVKHQGHEQANVSAGNGLDAVLEQVRSVPYLKENPVQLSNWEQRVIRLRNQMRSLRDLQTSASMEKTPAAVERNATLQAASRKLVADGIAMLNQGFATNPHLKHIRIQPPDDIATVVVEPIVGGGLQPGQAPKADRVKGIEEQAKDYADKLSYPRWTHEYRPSKVQDALYSRIIMYIRQRYPKGHPVIDEILQHRRQNDVLPVQTQHQQPSKYAVPEQKVDVPEGTPLHQLPPTSQNKATIRKRAAKLRKQQEASQGAPATSSDGAPAGGANSGLGF